MTTTAPTWTILDRDNLVVQLRMGHQYGLRLAGFYRRVATAFRFVQLLAGGSAVLTVFANSPVMLRILGAVLAITAAVDLAWNPSELASECEHHAERWAELDHRSGTMTDEDLSREVTHLIAMKAPTITGLVNPVFNDLMKTFGRDDLKPQPETWWQRHVIRALM